MKFHYPEFLFGLFLIAVPLIIHLFNFRKFKKIYFSNTQMLEEIKIQTSSWEKLKERLVLLSRILAVIFLVLAFSKPYFPGKEAADTMANDIVSIYVDNSYSMEAVSEGGSLFEEAKKKAVEVADAFPYNAKFQLLSNDLLGSQNRLLNRDEFLAELDSLNISPISNNFQRVLLRQSNFLRDYQTFNKYGFLVSDFQEDGVLTKMPLDSTISYKLVKLEAHPIPNVSVDSVWFITPIHQPNASEKLVFKIRNHSPKAVNNVAVNLHINGSLKSIANVSVKAESEIQDTLSFSGLSSGWHKAQLTIKDYPVVFDDKLYFTFEVKPTLAVTIISNEAKNNYFSQVFSTDAFFEVNNISESAINYNAFKQNSLIVLNRLTNVSEGLSQQLKSYVQNGGNLSVFLPLDANLESYRSFLTTLQADYPVALKKDTVKADKINLQHSLFTNLFDGKTAHFDLPRSSEYFVLSQQSRTTKTTLLSEGNLSLLNVYQLGKGNIYLSAYPIDAQVSNFAVHGLFLPTLFKMAMSSRVEDQLFYTIDHSESLVLRNVNVAESDVLKLKNGLDEIIPQVRNTENGTLLYFADQIKKAGFYELLNADKLLQITAFNDSRKESHNKYYTDVALKNVFGLSSSEIFNNPKSSISNLIKDDNLGTSLWKLCLILALLFLAVEILLIRFLKVNRTAKAS
ncbi:BatA domain-containing protein [Pseudopedobacter beijingensis]|uniref:BatA domain-containing protein n=1 Tax=Pseudopedobacter beijingensis TaxID=1207056 RepID=A0ABW4IBP1_9SPHI